LRISEHPIPNGLLVYQVRGKPGHPRLLAPPSTERRSPGPSQLLRSREGALITAAVWLFLRRRTKCNPAGSEQDNSADEGGEIKQLRPREAEAPHGQVEPAARRLAAEMAP
ncbi:uncharacterized protein P884DRAFT_199242, partial [Thermothelomyces heterothallicus CBS 202.75]|uniref:uncharacterized protein n=1 Tax=Thermothelomyces heterothallicus CBS 202.75 TaxID=1149848 RepID=UPI0037437917